MPCYDYRCPSCLATHEVYHRMAETPTVACPTCLTACDKLISCVAIKPPPDSGWENENSGRGRYISQLQTTPGKVEANAFCRSQNELVDKAARAGYTFQRAR